MKFNFVPQVSAQEISQGGQIGGPGRFQNPAEGLTTFTGLETLISVIVGAITAVAGLAFLIYFLLGGINWITAAGDQAKVDKAKKQLTDSAIGLIVVVVAYFIVGVVGTVLGLNILNPAAVLMGLQ